VADIRLELIICNWITAERHKEKRFATYGLLGDFGKPQNSPSIETEVTEPYWVPDERYPDKGRWKECITYSTSLTLACPITIKTKLLQTEVCYFWLPKRSQRLIKALC
jgi:hypothetical protein